MNTLPHSDEAEHATVAGILLDNRKLGIVSSVSPVVVPPSKRTKAASLPAIGDAA